MGLVPRRHGVRVVTAPADLQHQFAALTGRRPCGVCRGAGVLADRSVCRACLPAAVHAFELTQQLAVDVRAAKRSRLRPVVYVRAACSELVEMGGAS